MSQQPPKGDLVSTIAPDRVELQDLRVQVRALTRARDDNNQRIIELKAARDALLGELRRMKQIYEEDVGVTFDPKSLIAILTKDEPHLIGCEGVDQCKCKGLRPVPKQHFLTKNTIEEWKP